MTTVRWFAISLGLAFVLAGCNIIPSRPPASSFFAARLQDCKPEAEIPPWDNFAAGEVPALVLVNYAGRTVTIRVNGIAWRDDLVQDGLCPSRPREGVVEP